MCMVCVHDVGAVLVCVYYAVFPGGYCWLMSVVVVSLPSGHYVTVDVRHRHCSVCCVCSGVRPVVVQCVVASIGTLLNTRSCVHGMLSVHCRHLRAQLTHPVFWCAAMSIRRTCDLHGIL